MMETLLILFLFFTNQNFGSFLQFDVLRCEVVRCCQMLSDVVRCCQMLTDVDRCCQMLSDVQQQISESLCLLAGGAAEASR